MLVFGLMASLKKQQPNITRAKIAEILGKSVSTVANRQRDGYDLNEIAAIVQALDVSPVEVLLDLGILDLADLHEAARAHGVLGTFNKAALLAELDRRIPET
jgi:hypothetical protein